MRASEGLPTIAIVGRQNVGKSTLFSRIVGRRIAVVADQAGVTRDRNYAKAEWNDREFWLIDTGGFTLWEGEGIELEVQQQVELAIEEADLVILLLDGVTGLAPQDDDVIRALLRQKKPVLCAANKADNDARVIEAASIVPGGLGYVIPVSAINGRGVPDLLDAAVEELPEASPASGDDEDDAIRIAIVGRPNVGKSSIVNAILGEKKMVVSDIAGTTRDAVDTPMEVDGKNVLLIDTAGLRRRSRVRESVEFWSALRSSKALRRCDVAVLVMDATEEISSQDVNIAAEAVEEFKSVIVVANKWDAVEKDHDVARKFEDRVDWHFKFLPDAPILYVSALTGRRVDRILPEAVRLAGIRDRRIPTAQVNEVLRRIVDKHPPPSARSTKLTRVFYGAQVSSRPPTFAVFTNRPENLEGHYTRFLRNKFKEEFGFEGAHIKVVVRKREREESV